MDGGVKDQFENEKRNEDSNNYNSGNISSDWRFCQPNLSNAPLNLVSSGNPVPFCKEDLMRSSVSMVDSINPAIWEHPNNLQNVGYSDISVQNNLSTLNTLGILNGNPASLRSGIDRTHDMGWNPRMPMVKGNTLLPNLSEAIPESLSQFPVDSGLIERAARFSCFNGGNFTDMLNPFGAADPIGVYTRVEGSMPGPREVLPGNFVKPVHYMQQHNNDLDGGGASRDIPGSVKHGTPERSPQKNEGKDAGLVISQDKEKDCTNRLGNGADEAEWSGDARGSGHDDPSMLETTGGEASCKGLVSKKRRRGDEDAELDKGKGVAQTSEIDKDDEEAQQKVNQTPDCLANKGTGKNNKQGSQASDPPKEEYIHVRARRGQATNSHSLAERVRREKISERMKFLQDLVPGCSKVTGKAVMLDEIINYVQSLQRQVEFLSMKLATVNPRVDFNIEGLLAKDMLQSRAGPSSTLGFPPDMPMSYPPMHIPQPRLIQPGIPGVAGPDLVRRINNNSLMAPMTGGLKEPPQLPNHWEDELNNVVQMGFSSGATSSGQVVDGSLPQGHMKVEL